ncbi:SCD5-like protein [Mya arenaria]|uniref:SCD5-like protein n=1 Tax=Mya arenaria TaxID=6604 RepID=A0ABY7DFQ2_MYAAR|nr:stearoyl-CoA desaturase 5-like [Mya arenaria]XP_052772300.1 stearoyl-CoA desaturase 5-like [Mya arenaria]WAQ96114.1 SCD5-like protein [Mya arenaria]
MSPRAGEDGHAQVVPDGPVAPEDSLGLTPEVVDQRAVEESERPALTIVWKNVVLMSALHIGALYGLWLLPQASWKTMIFCFVLYEFNAIGITAGAHRLWSHRSYKARLPLRIFLAMCDSMAFQNDVIEWARDHRVHHKYSETHADPHNAKRGFFFAHVGWLLVRKHPEVKNKGKLLDISDLLADPVLRLQRKIYVPSVILMCFVMPTVVPWYFWGESAFISYFVCALFRYSAALNATWLVNSAAHMWGWKPYDVRISPSENPVVALLAAGEGFHNYHHTFPHDYSTNEFGWILNLSTVFIDVCALLGLAYDRKAMPKHFIESRRAKTGDKRPLAKKLS